MENKELGENVIQGPWEKSEIAISSDVASEVTQNIKFADELTEGVMLQLVHSLSENGVDVSAPDFIRDLSLIIVFTKASIYRDVGLHHRCQYLMQSMTSVTIDENDNAHGEVDEDLISELSEIFKNDPDEVS